MQTILAVTLVVLCICVIGIHCLRGYFRWIDECCSQLKNFSMENADSHCCRTNHLNEAGNTIMCDREIITECIRLWFGSEEAFESCVRSEVCRVLIKGVLDGSRLGGGVTSGPGPTGPSKSGPSNVLFNRSEFGWQPFVCTSASSGFNRKCKTLRT